MTTAEKGGGAWRRDRRGRERRLSVAESRPPEEMRGTLHSSTYAAKALARRVQSRQNRVQRVKSLRCAGWEYLRLASGEMHFSLFTRLMPWDHIPGSLIQREAGGLCQLLTGAPYRATDYREQGILMAPDAEAWQALAAALLQDDPKP